MPKTTVLMTGSSGFIGSALVAKLIDCGFTVIGIDIKDPPGEIKCLNKFIYYNLDISDENQMISLKNSSLMSEIHTIYHLAAQTSAQVSMEDPLLDIRTNVNGILNIIELFKESGTKLPNIVFTSSMAIYGNDSDSMSAHHTHEPKPCSIYGCTKLATEKIIKQSFDSYKILRLFNVYGPGQDLTNMKQGMLSIYIAQALNDKHIVVKGSLERTRDFVHIDDIVKALTMSIQDLPSKSIENLGTGIATDVLSSLKMIVEAFKKFKSETITFESIDQTPGDIHTSRDKDSGLNSFVQNPTSLRVGMESWIEKLL